MKKLLLVSAVLLTLIVAGCIGGTTTETKVSRSDLYSKLKNETTLAVTWSMELLNSTNGDVLARSNGKAVVYPNLIISYRESRGNNWLSKSLITWKDNHWKLIMLMTIDNQTKKFEDSKEFNVTIARMMAFPRGELEMLLLDNLKFNSTRVKTSCNDKCTLNIVRERSQVLFNARGEAWSIIYMEGNVTFNPDNWEISQVVIFMKTSEDLAERITYQFYREGEVDKLKEEIEKAGEEIAKGNS